MAKTTQPPWVIQFNGTSRPVLVAPFDRCRRWDETPDMPVLLQGKRCLGRDGDWSLMADERTNECFLVSFAGTSPSTPTVVALPPLPEDVPDLYLRFGCALSPQTPPDCTVFLDFVRDESLLYCRPGDPEWSRLPVEFDEEGDEFDGPITAGHQGKVYATTMASLVAVDASGPTPSVIRTDMRHPPPCPVHKMYKCFPVPCPGGELFLVRCCFFSPRAQVVDLKVFLWNHKTMHGRPWKPSGREPSLWAGVISLSRWRPKQEPGPTVHVTLRVCGEFGIYTLSLDDMTIRLSIVEGCGDEDQLFWALPTSFGLKAGQTIDTIDDVDSEVIQTRIKHCRREEEKEDMTMSTVPCPEERQWCDLHTDLFQLLVPKISFIDFLHLKAVCKQWTSSNSSLIQDAKVSPLLMTTRPAGRNKEDLLEVFDPVSEKKYSIRINIAASGLKSQGSQLLHFTKNGWVIVSRGGDHMYFLVNPFKNYPDGGHVIALPPLDIIGLKGLSFSSVPGSSGFVVLALGCTPRNHVVIIQTWRIGDKERKEESLGNEEVPFIMASHSPVFLDGVVYFLDINGRLGVVDLNADEMEWKVLDKPNQPIRGSDDVHTLWERDYSYLAEWKRELVAIIREGEYGFRIFMLDRSRMVWTELEGMKDVVVFWDRSNALIARPPCQGDLCNKVYLPGYTETDNGGRAQAYYCLEEQDYYPSFYAKEPINAIWFQPNLEDILDGIC